MSACNAVSWSGSSCAIVASSSVSSSCIGKSGSCIVGGSGAGGAVELDAGVL